MEHGAEHGDGFGVTTKRRISLLPTRRGDPRASVAAFAVQALLLFIIVPSFLVPVAMDFLRDVDGNPVMPERVSFITAVPEPTGPQDQPRRDGGDGRAPAEGPVVEQVPLTAPATIPVGVPGSPSSTPAPPSGGVGPLVGGGGPTQGVRPSFTDPRLWISPSGEIEAPMVPMTRADSLQAILNATAMAYVDSVNRETPAAGRAPGDWTFERNGKKYGIDPAMIRLGNFSIPTALVGLLPMNNMQANPIALDRARRLSSMRNEIIAQAERRARDDDFYAAVRALRERKEKERRDAEEARRASTMPSPPDR